MFRETEGPVVILFIAVIIILLYNYVGDYIETNNRLNETIEQQQLTITKKTKENQQLSELVGYMYFKQTGKQLPPNWTLIPREDYRPVH